MSPRQGQPQTPTENPEEPTGKANAKGKNDTASACARQSNERTPGSPTSASYAATPDRYTARRLGPIALAMTLVLAIKLIKWAERWNDY